MVEGGARLSSRASTAAAPIASDKHTTAGHWGGAVRTALLSPGRGFRRILELARAGPGGWKRTVLVALPAALGGAFLLLVFLKVRSLTGFRAEAPDDWGVFAAGFAVAALAGVLAHFVFPLGATPLLGRLGRRVAGRDLRLIAGVAALPAAIGFTLLVVVDVLIAGREAYSEISGDTLLTGWTAGSLALAVAAGAWSLYLFMQALALAAEIRLRRSIMVVVVAGAALLLAGPVAFFLIVGVVNLVGLLVEIFQAVSK